MASQAPARTQAATLALRTPPHYGKAMADTTQHEPEEHEHDGDEIEAVVPRTPPTLKERRQQAESTAAVAGGLMLCGLVATFVLMYNGSRLAMPMAAVTAVLTSLATYFFRRSLSLGREERDHGAT